MQFTAPSYGVGPACNVCKKNVILWDMKFFCWHFHIDNLEGFELVFLIDKCINLQKIDRQFYRHALIKHSKKKQLASVDYSLG